MTAQIITEANMPADFEGVFIGTSGTLFTRKRLHPGHATFVVTPADLDGPAAQPLHTLTRPPPGEVRGQASWTVG